MYPAIHEIITTKALKNEFTRSVLKYICESNKDSDNIFHLSISAQHFTDSTPKEGIELINKLRDIFINELHLASLSLENGNDNEVYKGLLKGLYAIGRMFHVIQDFYSHTNWINLTGPEIKAWNESIEFPNLSSFNLLKTCKSGIIKDSHKFFKKEKIVKNLACYSKFYDPAVKEMSHFELSKDGKKTLADMAYKYNYGISGFWMAYRDAKEHTALKWISILELLDLESNPGYVKVFNLLKTWDIDQSAIRQALKESRIYVDNKLCTE